MKKIIVDIEVAKNWVHEFVKTHNELPGLKDWKISTGAPYNKEVIYREFGSPNGVLELCGYRTRGLGQLPDLDETLLEELRKFIIMHKTTDRDVLRGHGLKDRSVYEKRFGSWSKAITLSGIDNRHRTLLRYYDGYDGRDPIEFLKETIGVNNQFTQEQLHYINRAQELDGDPKLVRKHINYNKIQQLFGYTSILLIAAGFIPNVDWKTGVKYIANDGHSCDSKEEAELDNYLTGIGYSHETQVQYPGSTKMTCDFVVNGVFIEYAGLLGAGYEGYLKAINKKKSLAIRHGIQLVVVEDLSERSQLKIRAALESNLYRKTP